MADLPFFMNKYFFSLEITQNDLQRSARQTNDVQRGARQANEPPADPSYDFAFRTPEYQRRENADNLGRVRGKLRLVE